MSNGNDTNGNGNGAVAAAAAAAKETTGGKREVRIQFLCEKRQVEKREEVPSGLIGQDAARRPHMQPMFERTLRPIVMRHAAEALDACEDKCSSKGCDRDATTIVATPMSYLHNVKDAVDDPFVIVMTVACCGSAACDATLKQEARELMLNMVGQAPNQAIASFGFPPMSRGAKCYCGSGRKYKKCCAAKDGGNNAAAAAAAAA